MRRIALAVPYTLLMSLSMIVRLRSADERLDATKCMHVSAQTHQVHRREITDKTHVPCENQNQFHCKSRLA